MHSFGYFVKKAQPFKDLELEVPLDLVLCFYHINFYTNNTTFSFPYLCEVNPFFYKQYIINNRSLGTKAPFRGDMIFFKIGANWLATIFDNFIANNK